MSRIFSKMATLSIVPALLLVLAPVAEAHKFWLLPSQTVLADEGWITVDAAISNDLFYFNYHPMSIERLEVIAPDGSKVEPQNVAKGKFRNTFDLDLKQKGTYRLSVQGNSLSAVWREGDRLRRWRGSAESLAKEVPATAAERKVSQTLTRLETFVTLGEPTQGALTWSGQGLELQPVTHPNDLYVGEKARFRLLLDGKPATGVDVEIVPGGSRYRDQQNEIRRTTDDRGEIEVIWPNAGMYWLEASLEDGNPTVPGATARNASYTATLEVLNE